MSRKSVLFVIFTAAVVYMLVAIYGAEADFNELVKIPETPLSELVKAQYQGIKMYLIMLTFVLIWTRD